MQYVDIVTALAILQFTVFGFKVGKARGTYGVHAPAVSGHAMFERYFRVQQNTLELLLLLLPGLYLFSRYFNPIWAAGLGTIYLVGREIYAASYVKNPPKRELGYLLSALPAALLIGGGGVGAALAVLHSH